MYRVCEQFLKPRLDDTVVYRYFDIGCLIKLYVNSLTLVQ